MKGGGRGGGGSGGGSRVVGRGKNVAGGRFNFIAGEKTNGILGRE